MDTTPSPRTYKTFDAQQQMLHVQQRLAAFQSHARPGQPLLYLIPTAPHQIAGFGEMTQAPMSKSSKHDPTASESSRFVSNLGSSRQEKSLLGKKDGARGQLGQI
jgi:hypothetical protein